MDMKFNYYDNEYDIKFVTDTYADMFQRLYIGACTDEEFWGDVTINAPQIFLDKDEVICSNDSPSLVSEMIKQGYLKFVYDVSINMGTYKICKVTKKLKAELNIY